MKKSVGGILNKYLEEGNMWGSWKNMYVEVKGMVDNVVDENGMWEYRWMGEEDGGCYWEVWVNNEGDVGEGKYKVMVKYKDIVGMEEIRIKIVMDGGCKWVNIWEKE